MLQYTASSPICPYGVGKDIFTLHVIKKIGNEDSICIVCTVFYVFLFYVHLFLFVLSVLVQGLQPPSDNWNAVSSSSNSSSSSSNNNNERIASETSTLIPAH